MLGVLGIAFLPGCTWPSPDSQVSRHNATVPVQTTALSLTLDDPTENGLQAILGTTVLRPGSQRVSFLLATPDALVTVPAVTVTSFYNQDPSQQPRETTSAHFTPWPYGIKGNYTTELSFDRQGTWRLDIDAGYRDGAPMIFRLFVDVQNGFGVIDINSVPPLSFNKTLSAGATLGQLTSAFSPDPDLYSITIAEAISSGQPTMVVFATPAFCVSPTCGPQVDTVQAIKEQYQGLAHFIHIESYDNPEEIQGDLSKARFSPIVREWGLTTIPHWTNESWVFIIGRDGRVKARFEAYTPASELEKGLLKTFD